MSDAGEEAPADAEPGVDGEEAAPAQEAAEAAEDAGGDDAPVQQEEAPIEAGAEAAGDEEAAAEEEAEGSGGAGAGSPEPPADGDDLGEPSLELSAGGEGVEGAGADDMSPGGAALGDSDAMSPVQGGEDDDMLAGLEEDEGDEFGEDGFDDDETDPIQELQEKCDTLHELNERAMTNNVALQRRVIQRKMQDRSYDASEKPSEGKVTEHRYQNVLHNVHSVRLKLRLQQVKAARMSEELKNQLEAKRQKAIECRDSFQEFKRQVAKHAEYARTGKKIPEKIIQEVEEFELDKDAEVEEVRGSNISLKNRLTKLEQALRKKDELADNLHVIDFEQLKIENQTLNEKIEERNEELHKLRKKTVVTVQIITHMREKVQFVQQEYQGLKAELARLDQELSTQRDLVAKTKHERDEHRSEYGKLRQQTGIMNSEHLTRDFEARNEHIKKLKNDIGALKKRHSQMHAFIKRHGGKI